MLDKKKDLNGLMELVKQGNMDAFGEIYETYFTPIFRYLYIRLKSREEAEDLTQTVFIKAFQAAPRFQDTGKPPLAFLYTIARNTLINFWRKKKEITSDNLEEQTAHLAMQEETVEEKLIQKEKGEVARQAIQKLTPDQQDVITLKFISEFSNKEVAQVLGKTEEAVRQLQSRGLRALRDHINEI
jgi:RNA polymerase sigma-70 factor, ECF subfamily